VSTTPCTPRELSSGFESPAGRTRHQNGSGGRHSDTQGPRPSCGHQSAVLALDLQRSSRTSRVMPPGHASTVILVAAGSGPFTSASQASSCAGKRGGADRGQRASRPAGGKVRKGFGIKSVSTTALVASSGVERYRSSSSRSRASKRLCSGCSRWSNWCLAPAAMQPPPSDGSAGRPPRDPLNRPLDLVKEAAARSAWKAASEL